VAVAVAIMQGLETLTGTQFNCQQLVDGYWLIDNLLFVLLY